MSIKSFMQSQGGNPKGILGRLIGRLMNINHNKVYKLGLERLDITRNINLLDIGCGGGKFLKILAEQTQSSKLYGMDHSEDMVKLANKLNKNINEIEIKKASVTNIPFEEDTFDIVTAFETIQFWPELKNSIKEVNRVLKNSGTFLVINRYPDKNSKWNENLQIKDEQEYIDILSKLDFRDISCDIDTKKGWILVEARK